MFNPICRVIRVQFLRNCGVMASCVPHRFHQGLFVFNSYGIVGLGLVRPPRFHRGLFVFNSYGIVGVVASCVPTDFIGGYSYLIPSELEDLGLYILEKYGAY